MCKKPLGWERVEKFHPAITQIKEIVVLDCKKIYLKLSLINVGSPKVR